MAAALTLEDLGYPAERTIYFGESLGTGVVSALQARRPPAGVVLRSPFPELADGSAPLSLATGAAVVERQVPGHRASVQQPGAVDRHLRGPRLVVPTELSARVADEAPTLVERVAIRGANHNDEAMFGLAVADAVARLAKAVG